MSLNQCRFVDLTTVVLETQHMSRGEKMESVKKDHHVPSHIFAVTLKGMTLTRGIKN